MRMAVAVVDFMFPFEGDPDFLKNGFASVVQGVQMFLFEPLCEIAQGFLPAFQIDLVGLGQCAHIIQMQGFVQKTAESRLGKPIVERHRQLQLGMGRDPLLQQVLDNDQLAIIQFPQIRVLLLLPLPDSSK